jgi:hypothetical protein
LDQE